MAATKRSKGLRTAADVRKDFVRRGETVAGWAREHGYPYRAVWEVLVGRNKGRYGMAHSIAVALGLKDGAEHGETA